MIPFNKPYYSGSEKKAIALAMDTKILTGDTVTQRSCESRLEEMYGFPKVCLTNSCTMALEMAALVAGIQPGDEVIMPSYTYVSTANAFALRGARIIFADSREDQPNIDENLILSLITTRTKAIVVVHYAGFACDIDRVREIADENKLLLIEDAAQCIGSRYKGKPVGSFGDIACFSFHETKNIHCGEGGFMVINDQKLIPAAELIRNKGTNRTAFSRGEVKKYEWVSLGYSSMPSALTSSFLSAQLGQIEKVNKKRNRLWQNYFRKLKTLHRAGLIGLPQVPAFAEGNGHIFYFTCASLAERDELIAFLGKHGIQAVFHYQALHSSPYYGSHHDGRILVNSTRYSECLVRLPLYYDLKGSEQDHICSKIIEFYVRS